MARPHDRQLVLAVDLDQLDASELIELQRLREFGWAGTLIAIGLVTPELRRALGVRHAIPKPVGSEALRAIISDFDPAKITQAFRAVRPQPQGIDPRRVRIKRA